MNLSRLSPRERLAAEQAILTLRALDKAADDAPHGQGFACLEAVREVPRHRTPLRRVSEVQRRGVHRGSSRSAVEALGWRRGVFP